jgi:hypothetical protein
MCLHIHGSYLENVYPFFLTLYLFLLAIFILGTILFYWPFFIFGAIPFS